MSGVEITTMIQNIITSIGIIVGGIWAIWKWGFQSSREMTSVDGEIVFKEYIKDNFRIVSLDAYWNNTSKIPIALDVSKTEILIHEIQINSKLSDFTINNNIILLGKVNPTGDLKEYILEPETKSIMQYILVLDKNKFYFLQWFIREKEDGYFWSRDVIIDNHQTSSQSS